MRSIHSLPLVAAVLLAACGGGAEEATEGEALTGDELAAEAEDMVQLRPGQYRASLELLEFEAPGMPEGAIEQAQQIYSSGLTDHTFCMTEADVARNGPEQMVQNLADSECTMESFDASGGSVVAEMQCAMEDGVTSNMRMEGQMTPNGSTMTMDTTQTMPGMGETHMKMRVTSERIGECA